MLLYIALERLAMAWHVLIMSTSSNQYPQSAHVTPVTTPFNLDEPVGV